MALYSIGFAKEFVDTTTGRNYTYTCSTLEMIGQVMYRPFEKCVEISLRNIKTPIMIVAFTMIALVSTTVFFYPPMIIWNALVSALPFIEVAKPWMIKAVCYILMQGSVLGLGLRTLGRLSHKELMQSIHSNNRIQPKFPWS